MTAGVETRVFDLLLVEDNPGDIRLIEEALKEGKIPHRLHKVRDGAEATEFLFRTGQHADAPRPDLVLLDLNLPKKDGREVLAEIKGDSRLKLIPVVVLTTSEAEGDILKAYDLNANCYITKPVDLDEMIKVVLALEGFWLGIAKLPRLE